MKIGNVQVPSNIRMFGFILDREHIDVAGEILRTPGNRNADMLGTLSLWRRREEFAFVVIAGRIDKKSGAIGGLADDWEKAKLVYAYTHKRLDEIGAGSMDGFTSLWLGFLTDERRAEWEALSASLQETVGSA